MRRVLKKEHEVAVATSGEQAMTLLDKDPSRFDVILSDVMMPVVSGMDLHQWLKERDPDAAGRMVFITAGAFTPRATAFLQQEEIRCLSKPFDLTELKTLVREMVLKRSED